MPGVEGALAPLLPQEAHAPRTLAGTYRIVRRLGAGATSDVFEAEHVRLGSRVAVKVLKRELATDRRALSRFRREARTLAALSEDNVVRVFDFHEDAEHPFFVMERLKGRDLRQELAEEGALAEERALHIALDICRGLAALHRMGLVHRDVKPANLFLTCDSKGREVCKILDLGVARGDDVQTNDRALVGTLRYMAPEQIVDSASVGPAADVYATAAVLYHCITGRAPHGADTVEALMFEILNRAPKPPIELCPGMSRELNELIVTGLSRHSADRPASILVFARKLESATHLVRGAATDDTLSVTISEAPASARRVRGSARPLGYAAIACAAFAALLAAASWFSGPASPAPRSANPEQHHVVQTPTHAPVRATLPAARSALVSAVDNPSHGDQAVGQVSSAAPRALPSSSSARMPSAAPAPRAHPASAAKGVLVGDFDQRNPYED